MKSGSRVAYQKVQEAKRNARAQAAAQEVGTSTTPPRRQSLGLGTSSQPVLVNPIPTPPLPPSAYVPSVLSSSEPEKKKRKISEAGASNVGDTGFDGVKFSRKHILPYSQIAMDDAAIRNHLQILIREGIRTAGVCTSLLDILEKTPLSAIQSSVEHLKGRIALYQEEERKLQEENAQLKEELAQIREREKKLMGQCAMTEGLKEKVEQNYVRLFVDKIELKEELDKLREGYQELEESMTEGIEVLFEVLKEQIRVLAPDLDLSPLHPDKVVVDGAIVSPPHPATDSELKTAGQRIIESPPREVDMPFSFSAPEVIRAPDAEEIPPTHSTSAAESTSPADDSNPFIGPQ